MKKIFLIVGFIWSVVSLGQPTFVPGYITVNEKRNQLSLIARALNLPVGTVPNLAAGQPGLAGAVYIDTTGGNKGFYFYMDGVWLKVVDTASYLLNQIDVFLIGGQSNAVGFSGAGGAAASPNPVSGTVYQYYSSSLSIVSDEVGAANTGSAWPSFGITYYNNTGRKVLFVPAAVTGSAQTALAEAGFGYWGAGGPLYTTSISLLSSAMAAAKNAGFNPVFKGVLWCQGEADGNAIQTVTETKQQYKDTLSAMITNFRTSQGAMMPFYIYKTGVRTPAGTYETAYAQIRAAQQELADADPLKTFVVFQGAEEFNNRSLMVDQYHYSQTGLNEMGQVSAENIVGETARGFQRLGTGETYFLGNVGINTDNPAFSLDVSDSARVNNVVIGQQGGANIGTNTDADFWLKRGNLNFLGLRKIDASYPRNLFIPQTTSIGVYPFGYSGGATFQMGTYLSKPWMDIVLSGAADSTNAFAVRFGKVAVIGSNDFFFQLMPASAAAGTGNYARFAGFDFEGVILSAGKFSNGGNPTVAFQTNYTTRGTIDSARIKWEVPITIKERGLGANPVSGYGSLYANPDGTIHYVNSAGTDYDLTASGGSSVTAGFGLSGTTTFIVDTTKILDKLVGTNISGAMQTTALLTAAAGINLTGSSSPLQVGGSAGTSGYVLKSAGSGNTPTWVDPSTIVLPPFNFLTAASGTNDINNANLGQIWRWNTLAGVTALTLSANSTAAASGSQMLLFGTLSGTNATSAQTTVTAKFSNSHDGTTSTNYGIIGSATNGTTANISIQALERLHVGSPTYNASVAANIQSQTNSQKTGALRLYAANLSAFTDFGYGGMTYAGQLSIEGDGGVQIQGNTAAVYFNMTGAGLTNIGGSATATSNVNIQGSFGWSYVAKSADYTATISDCIIEVTATGKTITLPTAVGITGRIYTVKLTSSTSTGTVATTSSQTIDGSTTYSLSAQYKYVTVQSNGANWNIIANN